jgi:AbrB family looped-hinge helix DNA binding protein
MKSRFSMMDSKDSAARERFFGSVTVGERGQIVIPARARAELGIVQGDKLLVMKTPVHDGLMICKPEALHYMLETMREFLAYVESSADEIEPKHKEER